jgi:hypothetical protein
LSSYLMSLHGDTTSAAEILQKQQEKLAASQADSNAAKPEVKQ